MCSLHIHHATYNNGTFCTLFILPIKITRTILNIVPCTEDLQNIYSLGKLFKGNSINFSSDKNILLDLFYFVPKKNMWKSKI